MGHYPGPERRRHQMIVTRNTEYHLRDACCVGVRRRDTDTWLCEHPAVGSKLFGVVRPTASGLTALERPEPGARLWFEDQGQNVVTSFVQAVERPHRATVGQYVL